MLKIFKACILLSSLCLTGPLYGVDILCGGYDTTKITKAEPFDTVRMLVIAMTAHEDSAHWDSLGMEWPRMPDWLVDSFLMPYPWDETQVNNYPKSFTHYLYTESQGNHILVGEVNPGLEDVSGFPLFFVPDSLLYQIIGTDTILYYPTYGSFKNEIKAKADIIIDFSLYDYIVWLYPRRPIKWPLVNRMGGYPGDYGSTGCPDFNLGTLGLLSAHEYGHSLGLPDKYDAGKGYGYWMNPYSASGVTGIYSQMRGDMMDIFNPVTHALPYSPYDKIRLGWITPIEITDHQYNLSVGDFATTGDIYKIPFLNPTIYHAQPDTEYFLIVNHQQKTYWEDEYKNKGVLIWHIQEKFQYDGPHAGHQGWSFDYISEKRKREDVECAIGLYDTSGAWQGVSIPCPEMGYDNIDNCNSHRSSYQTWYDTTHNGSYRDSTDFFPLEDKNEFTHLTNPSSNGYNWNQRFNFVYGAGEYEGFQWGEVIDSGIPYAESTHIPENIATHIAIKNIHEEPVGSGIMKMDVLIDYVQSDKEIATAGNNARHLVWDGQKSHMVYASNGHIYYTYRYYDNLRQKDCWMPAIPLDERDYTQSPYPRGIEDNNKYPAIALNGNNEINICWIKSLVGGAKLYYYHKNSGTQEINTSQLTGGASLKGFAPPAIVVDANNQVHLALQVFTATPPQWYKYKVWYGTFPVGNPAACQWELVKSRSCGGDTPVHWEEIFKSPSIDIDRSRYPHIAFSLHQCDLTQPCEIYYANKLSGIWVSECKGAGEHPFIDVHGTIANKIIDIVYEKDNNIWLAQKDGGWTIGEVHSSANLCCSPQILNGSVIVWSELISGQYEILYKYQHGAGWTGGFWNLTNTATNSKYPQIAVEPVDMSDCCNFKCIWTEGDEAPYEIKFKSRELPSPAVDYEGEDFTITSDATLSGIHWNIDTFTINSGVTVSVASYDKSDTTGMLIIDANVMNISGTLSGDMVGYAGGEGPGAGTEGRKNNGAGGAGYGGRGGDGKGGKAGGSAYADSVFGNPETYDWEMGSGGGNSGISAYKGGAGGGKLKLACSSTMTIDGNISVNGGSGNGWGAGAYTSGGGSGGSIWLIADSLAGTGYIYANGGNGYDAGWSDAGGGAGGRVHIKYGGSSFNGGVSVNGGNGPDKALSGQLGSIWIEQKEGLVNIGISSVDTSGTRSSPEGSISAVEFKREEVALLSNGTILGNTYIKAQNNIIIPTGASINASSKGYHPGEGPGEGTDGSKNYGAGGAGYGGNGGDGKGGKAGGSAYGNSLEPADLGSGGGNASDNYEGGTGGGKIKLNSTTGSIIIDGIISANGGSGSGWGDYASGGGSGGSVWLLADSLAGTGYIYANGGNGADEGWADAGGGAGGRVCLARNKDNFTGTVEVTGGVGPGNAQDGEDGTIDTTSFGGGGTQSADGEIMPMVFKFSQNYPNPFVKSTIIKYQIPVKSKVSLRIYDVAGRCVKTLIDGEKSIGYYKVKWDGEGLSTGIYFAKFTAGDYKSTKKLILMR